MVLNPAHPDYYYYPFVINHFRLKEYKEALRYAKMIDMSEFYWTHIHYAAIFSETGDIAKAKDHTRILKKLYPNIENEFVTEFNKWHPEKTLVDKYISALQLTGLQIQSI